MSEILVKKKPTFMDNWDQKKIDSLTPEELEKYNRRDRVGDIIEIRPDGYWKGKRGFDKDGFICLSVSINLGLYDIKTEPIYEGEKIINKRRWNVDVAGLVLENGIATITAADLLLRAIDKSVTPLNFRNKD